MGNRTAGLTTVNAAVTSYKGVAGSNWIWGTAGNAAYPSSIVYSSFGSVYHFDPFLVGNGNAYGNGNGVFFPGYQGQMGSPVSPDNYGFPCQTNLAAVRDGMSNTFMIGESVAAFDQRNWWYWFDGATATCAIPLNASPRCAAGAYGNRRLDLQACAGDWQNNYGFASEHVGLGQFSMADGSVHQVANSIDREVYRALAGMQDGVVASISE